MTVPPKSLEVGKCYLTNTHRVWRIVRLMPDGRVLYEHRSQDAFSENQKPGMLTTLPAEVLIKREVPCDWTPEGDETTP
jgi:hypothetical protein